MKERFTMRFLFALLLLCIPACGGDNQSETTTPNEVVTVQALIDRFDDTEIVVRTEPWYDTRPAFVDHAEAVAAFGDCAVDPLIVALEDENPQVRVAAAVALEMIGPAAIKAKPILEEMLQSDDDRTNILACGIIRGIGGPDAIELTELVVTLLDNENFHVQYWACRALGGVGPRAAPVAAGKLIELLETGVASVRRNAAVALGDIAAGLEDQSVVIQALERTTKDYSHLVREAAEEALTKISTEGGWYLTVLINDDSCVVTDYIGQPREFPKVSKARPLR